MTTEQTPNTTLDDAVQRANEEITEAYDRRVYTSNAFSYSSPGHLRAAAHLYGLESVPLENARVLELGCAGGGNLLPFALAYPHAHVVGVDLSSVQVNQGMEVVQALGLQNLHLRAMSLTDITPEFGQFDYIIAHGVFSWVPPEVREAMLRILRDNLSPKGVGYISYNTYPGWKAGDIVRDAMLLHSHGGMSDDDKLARAKAMLNLLSEGSAPGNRLAPSLRAAVDQLRKHSDYYIAHEYLETFNNPCYLLEFVNLADQFGLAHVGDVDAFVEMPATYGANVQIYHSLVAMGQPPAMRQQYLDFAVGRNFRKSLLVHANRAANAQDVPDTARLAELRWAGYFSEVEPPAGAAKERRAYRSYKGQPLHTSDPVVVAIIRELSHVWPESLDFDTLLQRVRADLPDVEDEAGAHKKLLLTLQTLFRLNSLRYALEPAPYDTLKKADQKTPTLIPGFAYLWQRRSDPGFGVGTFNLWHDSINLRLHDGDAFVLKHIDGQRTRKQLAILLRDALNRGDVPSTDGKSLKGQRNLDAIADQIVGKTLDLLNRTGVLV